MKTTNTFLKGLKDGIPICLGYLSVAFAFGIFATSSGLSVNQSVLISMSNVTSAGQLAGVPLIISTAPLIEMAITQLIINLRYSLMSISLSQKFDKSINFIDRLIIAFVNTDEVFAVARTQKGYIGKKYMYGLIITPFIGWIIGTLIGAIAGNILPGIIVSSLGIAIYGMFIAIIIPTAKKNKSILSVILTAILFSCAFKYIPILNKISGGFVIIICTIIASTILAFISPIKEEEICNND